MPIKVSKPTTPSRRHRSIADTTTLTKKRPEKSLSRGIKHHAGRNNKGRITTRHRGGRHKRLLRNIDFKRDKTNIKAKVTSIEYDPNRNCHIALLSYQDGEKRYILCPHGLKIGDQIISAEKTEINPGNSMQLKNIPEGIAIHNIELKAGKGGQIVRSAGTFAQIVSKEGKYVTIKLPSGELRLILGICKATIGQVGNIEHHSIKLGKAGRKRHMGIRPTVRGVAQHPGAHPHGGGEGRSGIGMPSPKSPWGKKTLGKKTRRSKKYSNKFIIKSRKTKK